MWSHDISCDITPLLMSFLLSKGPNVCLAGGVSNMGMVIGHATDLSLSTAFMRVAAVHFDMSGAIAKDTLCDLGTPLCGVSCARAPFAIGVLIVWAVFPPIGEVGNACVEYSRGNIGGYGGIVENPGLESSIGIGMSQCLEGVVLVPSHVPIEPFEFGQIFCKVGHPLMCISESLDFSSQRGISLAIEGEVDHW